jgi:hypothetical protein
MPSEVCFDCSCPIYHVLAALPGRLFPVGVEQGADQLGATAFLQHDELWTHVVQPGPRQTQESDDPWLVMKQPCPGAMLVLASESWHVEGCKVHSKSVD